MENKKVLLVILALAGFAVVAAGGLRAVLEPGSDPLSTLVVPFLHGSLWDTVIVLASLIFLVWALLPTGPDQKIGRTQLLQGIALGSALVVCGCLGLLFHFEGISDSRLPGALGLVALLQAGVGLLAGILLFIRRESRRSGITPLLANGGLTTLVVLLTHGHQFA